MLKNQRLRIVVHRETKFSYHILKEHYQVTNEKFVSRWAMIGPKTHRSVLYSFKEPRINRTEKIKSKIYPGD